jgi:hypothetical protein
MLMATMKRKHIILKSDPLLEGYESYYPYNLSIQNLVLLSPKMLSSLRCDLRRSLPRSFGLSRVSDDRKGYRKRKDQKKGDGIGR